MAVVTLYDSVTFDLPANEWGGYFIVSELGTVDRPREVGISMEPAGDPGAGWNLAGWACIEYEVDSVRWTAGLTPVGLGPAETTVPYAALVTDSIPRATGRLVGFRGVRWNIHRWVGPCRIRIIGVTG